jgi:hypothetical protein
MNVIEFSSPAPCCLVPITHPARAVEREPDVARTFKQHMTADLHGDYEKTDSLDRLSNEGQAK